jgi:hypothetical protein
MSDATSEQPQAVDSPASQPSIEDRLAAKFDLDGPDESNEQEQDQPQEAADEQTETTVDDSEEVAVDGKTYRVPRELKDAVLRHADYTRKTQEIAERARALDAQSQVLQVQQAFQQEASQDFATLSQLDAALAAYQKVDFTQLDTDSMMKMRMQIDQLKDAREKAVQALTQKQQFFQHQREQAVAAMRDSGQKVLQQAIPDWGPETSKSLIEYGVTEGYRQDELASILDPRMVKTLWKAAQWDKLQKGKPDATKRANNAPPVLKPGASSPEMNQRMEKVRFAKDMKGASTSQDKAKLIQKRLERMV